MDRVVTRGWSLGGRIGWLIVATAAAAVALQSAPRYLTLNPDMSRIPLNPAFPFHLVGLSLHAVLGGVALLVGPMQFVPALRARHPGLHRFAGRVYFWCVFVGSTAGVYAAVVSVSGLAAQVGFLLLTLAWSYSALVALQAIRNGHSLLHREWMIRNYAFTFAAVLLRLFLFAGLSYQTINPALTFADIYTSSVWSSIVVSYIFAEWFVVQRAHLRLGRKNPKSQLVPR